MQERADRDSKCQLGTWRRRWKLRQGEGGAQARGCNFGARDSSFGPSLKKGTRWRWRDVCQQASPLHQCPCCSMATAAAATLMLDASCSSSSAVCRRCCAPLDGYWLHCNGSQTSVAHPTLPILILPDGSELQATSCHLSSILSSMLSLILPWTHAPLWHSLDACMRKCFSLLF